MPCATANVIPPVPVSGHVDFTAAGTYKKCDEGKAKSGHGTILPRSKSTPSRPMVHVTATNRVAPSARDIDTLDFLSCTHVDTRHAPGPDVASP